MSILVRDFFRVRGGLEFVRNLPRLHSSVVVYLGAVHREARGLVVVMVRHGFQFAQSLPLHFILNHVVPERLLVQFYLFAALAHLAPPVHYRLVRLNCFLLTRYVSEVGC